MAADGEDRNATVSFPAVKKPRSIDWNKPYIVVEPRTARAIEGVTRVDRKRYFSIADGGVNFDRRVPEDKYDYLVHELGINFGRSLGLVKYPASKLKEDPEKPGFADLKPLMAGKPQDGSDRMKADFGDNLDVAMHGAHNAYPEYMGRHETADSVRDAKHPQYIPENIDAAALLAAAVLKFNYTDFTRPRYYELVNEPHWSFFNDQHLADWHLKTHEMVKKATPEVQVGGLCMSVCYFYRNNYRSFQGMKQFIDHTNGEMDFYSFHVYDYLRWRDGEYKGRLQSGLPLEGTLDLVPNYTMNEFGKSAHIVVSEQGGYNGEAPKGDFDGELVASQILSNAYPHADHDSWEMEMKKRSIVSFGHVSSIIANTLAFIDHPHTVQKAVPFILSTTWNWGPKYYAQLYVAKNYTDKSEWVEQDTLNFYRFFRGVDGHRVKALCSDPDLQTRAFVHENKLYLAINNQSFKPEKIDLYGIETGSVEVRRLGRNPDFTMSYVEKKIATPDVLEIAGRESVMLVADYGEAIKPTRAVNEVVCYGDKVTVPVSDATFKIIIPDLGEIDYAQLRVAVTRSPEKSVEPVIELNGRALAVPLEDSAGRYTDKEYASTKLVYVDPTMLKSINSVKVSFPDGDDGAVGSAVLRVAVKK
ncbi:beta-agarase [Verrucomicrobia bacterium S94]|nr:beta-agarase [Verrucomicrobia bacterium S94]